VHFTSVIDVEATKPTVFGTAPVIMNTCPMSFVSRLPVRLSRHRSTDRVSFGGGLVAILATSGPGEEWISLREFGCSLPKRFVTLFHVQRLLRHRLFDGVEI
jgi:hypothetical protein